MEKLLNQITAEVTDAFTAAGYDGKYGRVTLSSRPDLCEFQCNGAMAAAKFYKKAPFLISDAIAGILQGNRMFASVESVKPGFLNLRLSKDFLSDYLNEMQVHEKLGVEETGQDQTIIVDYGGANVAKPLHIGHLRSAIIGESIRRMGLYLGYHMIGDVHLGDWGLQMGLIIEELHDRKPDLVYFDESFSGTYPAEAPFTITELEEIYPAASKKSKEDDAFKNRAHQATLKLQNGYAPYRAIWNHIMHVSVADLKKNYASLDVHFDLWKGESDADPYIPGLIQSLLDQGIAYESQGALVVDIAEETDSKELPPCIVRKSDGAALYATSDLGTILEREKDFSPTAYIYLADKRQQLHFTQVFRVAKKAGFVKPETDMRYVGFGTMNGKDGTPFKTREGGVMRLEQLIADINGTVYARIMENRSISEEEAGDTAKIVGLAALKYGDLCNQASRDYVFDIDRFISFEGNTGPYILYTIVRIKSILKKYAEQAGIQPDTAAEEAEVFSEKTAKPAEAAEQARILPAGAADRTKILPAETPEQKDLMLELAKWNSVIETAFAETAPHKVCAYIYDLSNAFNRFYHGTKILAEEDTAVQTGYIRLLELTKSVLETGIDVLGFSAPERM
ncbi:MAG: arginine--tRNA ligase [Lachnospiraceae bacterium]|nr:arginine--tRNA ligase [Lachnospiraceae bacterium]